MIENTFNHPEPSPSQLTEAVAASDAERLRAEMPGSIGGMVVAAEAGQLDPPQPSEEAAEPQVHPSVERKRKAERAFFGSPDDLLKQIDEGELDVNDTDFEDRTAIMLMTAQGHTEAVQGLIDRKADVNRINMFQGRIPMSALDAARQTRRADIEQMLLESGAKSGRELQAEKMAAEQANN
jgi:ankyrin repeat protein